MEFGGVIVVGFGNKLGGDCMEGTIVTPVGVEVEVDGVEVFEAGELWAMVGVSGFMEGSVWDKFGDKEDSGIDSSLHLVWMILGGSSPFFTRMSVEVNLVEPEAFKPTSLYPWAKDLAFGKH